MPNEHTIFEAPRKEGLIGNQVSPDQSTPLRYKTYQFTGKESETIVVYYETAIVTFNDRQIILNTGGWWTASTKERMNWVSRKMNLGYRVRQSGQDWYVEYQGKSCSYETNQVRLDRETGAIAPLV